MDPLFYFLSTLTTTSQHSQVCWDVVVKKNFCTSCDIITSMTEKIIGIYHKDCLDGTTAAAILLKQFPTVLLRPLSHRYTEEDLGAIVEETDSTTIDHIGAEERLRALGTQHEHFTFVFNNDRSGASLTWIYFHGEKNIPKIILYVEDSDIWRFSFGDETRFAVSYLYGFSGKPEELLALLERGDSATAYVLERGKMIWEYRDSLTKILIESVTPVNIKVGEHAVPMHNTPEFLRSDVGHILSKKLGKTVATFIIDNHTVRLHFRGENEYSPSALDLAKILGGGGHRNAAGAAVSLKEFCEMIEK